MTVPFVDLEALTQQLKPELMAAMEAVIDSRRFIQGSYAKAFEDSFRQLLGAGHGIACGNGTAALSVALEALGVGPGDEVITVANTFIATAEAICHVGAKPVFVDVDPAGYGMDPEAAAAAIGPRTRALLPVHLYGIPARMDALAALARKHDLLLIEDCAQAHLARFGDRVVGTIGDAGTFSFYPGKNLGACGDAGFITAADDQVALRIRKLIDHGRLSKYEHDMVGYNQRMDGMQAAILSAKLPHLQAWTDNRRRAAARYDAALTAAGFQVPQVPDGAQAVYHLYVVQVSNRDETAAALKSHGIETGIHYPVPLHLQPAFAGLGGHSGQLPVTEAAAGRILSLPICGLIAPDAVDTVIQRFLEIARP